MSDRAGHFDTAVGGEAGDQQETEGRCDQRNRLDPSGVPSIPRRRRLEDKAGKECQRRSPGQEPDQRNRAGSSVDKLGDLLTQRVVRGLEQWLDRNDEEKKAEPTGRSDDSPLPGH